MIVCSVNNKNLSKNKNMKSKRRKYYFNKKKTYIL